MAFFKLECLGGQAEILAFSSVFDKFKDLLDNDEIVFVSGRPTDTSDFSDLKIIADEIVTLDKARDYFAKHVNIKFELDQMNPKDVDDFNTLAQKYHGSCGLMFHISRNGGKDQRIFAHNIRVSSGREFIKKLRDVYGKDNVWVSN
jgi:DNA polymerase-3 subunit alpha